MGYRQALWDFLSQKDLVRDSAYCFNTSIAAFIKRQTIERFFGWLTH